MSETTWTKEPWAHRPERHDDWGMIRAADGYPVASTNMIARVPETGPHTEWQEGGFPEPVEVAANATRIAACVNFCAGFSNDVLAAGPSLSELVRQVADLEAECAPFRPMSIEEAEKAFDEAEAMPLSESDIQHATRYATDPEYRADCCHKKYIEQHQISRGFKAELERLYTLIGAEIASEGPRNLEHLIATARLGKETTVIGRKRYEQLLAIEKDHPAPVPDVVEAAREGLRALRYARSFGSQGDIDFDENAGKSVSAFIDRAIDRLTTALSRQGAGGRRGMSTAFLEKVIGDVRNLLERWLPLPEGEAYLDDHGCCVVFGWHRQCGWLLFALNDKVRADELHEPIVRSINRLRDGYCKQCGSGPLMFSCRQLGTGLCHRCGHAAYAALAEGGQG